MTKIRLNPSASVTLTDVGVILRSDLGTFQLNGQDIQVFIRKMLPLLDGTCDKAVVIEALGQYSQQSVLAFLDLLEQYGLLEVFPETISLPKMEQWHSQEYFFRKWSQQPQEATHRLSNSRVLIVGLEPWGAVAATELAASGVGAIHLLDNGKVLQDDLLSVRVWEKQHLGTDRCHSLIQALDESFPWCRVTTSPLTITEDHCLTLELEQNQWDLIIGAVTADDLFTLKAIACYANKLGVVSLTGHLDGLDATVGPVVVPGQTACWNCCRLRQLANSNYSQAEHALHNSLLRERPSPRARTYLAPMAPLLGHLLALESIKLLSRYTPSHLVGRLLIQNLITLETKLHTVIRMPWCEVCGGASDNGGSPGGPILKDPDGGGRTENIPPSLDQINTPDALRQRMAGWVDARTGIIQYLLVNTPTATEPELPVTSSAILTSYTDGVYQLRETEIGSGKGLSSVEAMISAVGEAVERYSAARYRKSDLHRSSMNALQEDFLDPRHLVLYDETQYSQQDFPYARFNPDLSIDWVKGYWIDNQAPTWVPALPTYYNFHAHPQEYFCQVTSNGLAAGSTLEDASLRAIFELVERDAFMLTWLCQRPGQRLIPDNTLDVGAREVLRQLEERQVKVELYLLDVGISIPTVLCLGLGDGKNWPGATVSLATHANPRTASRKAILEQGHVGPYIRRLMMEEHHAIPRAPSDVRTLTDHALYYTPAERISTFAFLRFGSASPVALAELEEPKEVSLEDCSRRLENAGVRVAIADVTSPDVFKSPFRVVRALGTNMQPIHFGFRLRRLVNQRLQNMLTVGLNPNPHPLA